MSQQTLCYKCNNSAVLRIAGRIAHHTYSCPTCGELLIINKDNTTSPIHESLAHELGLVHAIAFKPEGISLS